MLIQSLSPDGSLQELIDKGKPFSSRGTIKLSVIRDTARDGILDIKPLEYQRNFQADVEWQRLLVASVFDPLILIPEITMRVGANLPDDVDGENMDGLQRIGSIQAFYNGEITLPEIDSLENFYLPNEEEPVDIRNTSWKQLLSQFPLVAEFFNNYAMSVMIYGNISAVQAAHIFVNILNNNNDLNAQEKRQAIKSYVSRLVQRLARGIAGTQHKLFEDDGKSSYRCKNIGKADHTRLEVDKTVAELCYMIAKELELPKTGTTSNVITKFYQSASINFVEEFPFEKRLLDALDTIMKGFNATKRASAKFLSLKEIRNLAFIISQLKKDKVKIDPAKFFDLYIDTLVDLKDKKYISSSDLTQTPYQLVMRGNQGSDTMTAINMIKSKMAELMDEDDPAVLDIDPRVSFPKETVAKKFDEQEGKCALCGEPMEFDTCHGDHIKPRSLGGRTEEYNCQATHSDCNIKKSNS